LPGSAHQALELGRSAEIGCAKRKIFRGCTSGSERALARRLACEGVTREQAIGRLRGAR
jgi:hypothetical protein